MEIQARHQKELKLVQEFCICVCEYVFTGYVYQLSNSCIFLQVDVEASETSYLMTRINLAIVLLWSSSTEIPNLCSLVAQLGGEGNRAA